MSELSVHPHAAGEAFFRRQRNKQLQVLVFLVVLPTLNLFFAAITLYSLNFFELSIMVQAACRTWAIFGLSLLVLRFVESKFPILFSGVKFWSLLSSQILIICVIGFIFSPIVDVSQRLDIPRVWIIPTAILILEITLYTTVIYVIAQQERVFSTALNLQQAQLKVARAQSNPHFLFNTLNLIVSEISTDPGNAKELIYDLSDLLRNTVKMAQNNFSTVSDELKMVEIYLNLQQKRFPDRLVFQLQIAPECAQLLLPSLLLQPVVENTIKHAVAPHASKAHIEIQVNLVVNAQQKNQQLEIQIKDSGPQFEVTQVKEGDGFRILRQTLQLHYPDENHITLDSTPEGGKLTLRFPSHNEMLFGNSRNEQSEVDA
ncbi:MAG: histidine kinase [Paraglaciecola sp.]|nr:histidine kinase [Paraglaciecola sp.]